MSLQNEVANIFADVLDEIEAAEKKHGPQLDLPLGFGSDQFYELSVYYTDRTEEASAKGECTWMHIAREEVFECFAEEDPEKARAEAMQAAAMFVQIVRKIDHDRGPVAPDTRVFSPDYGWGTVRQVNPDRDDCLVEWDVPVNSSGKKALLLSLPWVNRLKRGEAEAL